jgi:hypothetical protein
MSKLSLKRKLKLFFGKIWRKMGRTVNPDSRIPDLSPMQSKTVSIIRRIIRNPESTLLRDPDTGFFYCEYKHYFVKFSDNTAIITNGKFSYYVSLPYQTCSRLKDYFDNFIVERRKVLESQYDTNTLNNFDEILNSLS